MKKLESIKKIIKETTEMIVDKKIEGQKSKETVVVFDKSTKPFEVIYSERGFEIEDTRLSFEFIETALSKDANIVLNKGNGIVLDAIKINKILKYRDLY